MHKKTTPATATRLHTYQCNIYPQDMDSASVAKSAAAGMLARVRIKAHNAEFARRSAARLTGQIVHSVERIEPEQAAAAA